MSEIVELSSSANNGLELDGYRRRSGLVVQRQESTHRLRSSKRSATEMADRFTAKQGQYLAFIYNYTIMFGKAPAERELQRFFGTTPPTIHQMILKLAEKNLISRTPGQARSIRLLMDPHEIPRLLPPTKK